MVESASGPGETGGESKVHGLVDMSGDGTEDDAGNSGSGEMVRWLMSVASTGGC